MNTLQQYIAVIGCVQGLSIFVLFTLDPRISTASRLLGLQALVIASIFAVPFMLSQAAIQNWSWLAGWTFFLPATLGPLCYLYCRTVYCRTSLRWIDFVHFAPLALCYGLALEGLLFAPHDLAQWIVGERPNSLSYQASEIVLFAQAFMYAGWAGLLVWRARLRGEIDRLSYGHQGLPWVISLLGLHILIWILFAIHGFARVTPIILDVARMAALLFIYAIAFLHWCHPEYFRLEVEQDLEAQARTDTGRPQEASDGALDSDIRETLFRSVQEQLEQRELYLDAGLTLRGLAEETGLTPHHLSEVLNRHAGKNFYQLINDYRLRNARKMLAERSDLKILDIALQSGFASKSTFNTTFKRATGTTPSEFRRASSQK